MDGSRGRLDEGAACTVPALSIVAPCFNEADGLHEFHARATAAARAVVGEDFEIVLVDDGSRDATWTVIAALTSGQARTVGIKLLRNHGHQLAASCGLAFARGGRVLLIDADLQNPPELLADMMAALDAGAEVAYGLRGARAGETAFKRATASLFYRVLERLTPVPIPRDVGDFRLMSRRVVDLLTSMPERHRFLRGMVSWIGGRQVAVRYTRDPRHAGASGYPLARMIRLAVDAITGFSTVPLRMATWAGGLVSALAFTLAGYTLLRWASGQVVPGWASSVLSSSIFAGTQLFVLGIMGEYLGRLVEDAKRRPLFLIEEMSGASAVGSWRQAPPPYR